MARSGFLRAQHVEEAVTNQIRCMKKFVMLRFNATSCTIHSEKLVSEQNVSEQNVSERVFPGPGSGILIMQLVEIAQTHNRNG